MRLRLVRVFAWELVVLVCTTPVMWLGLLTLAVNATALCLYFTPAGRTESGGISVLAFTLWGLGMVLVGALSIAKGLEYWRARRGGFGDGP